MDPLYEKHQKSIDGALGVLQAQRSRAVAARKEAIERLRTATMEVNKLLPARKEDELTSSSLFAVEPVFDDKKGTANLRIRVVDTVLEFNISQDGRMHTRAMSREGEPIAVAFQPRDVAGAAPFSVDRIERIIVTNTSDGPRCSLVARMDTNATSSVSLVDAISQLVERAANGASKHATLLEQQLYGQSIASV